MRSFDTSRIALEAAGVKIGAIFGPQHGYRPTCRKT